MLGKTHYSVIAGLCGSAASLFGKLSGSLKDAGLQDSFILRAVCIILMIISNAMVWTFFAKSLQASSNSLAATVTSAATNFCLSAAFGYYVFNESTTPLVCLGIVWILTGIVFIAMESSANKNNKVK